MTNLGHVRMALMTRAKPLKNAKPSSSLEMATSSSKLAPAQNARSPADFNTITLMSSRRPASDTWSANCLRMAAGRLLEAGWKNVMVPTPRSSTSVRTKASMAQLRLFSATKSRCVAPVYT